MRHGKKFNHLSRTASHRSAMLSNMATSLILNKRIFTTLAKAKALRKYIEPLLTKSKIDTTTNRRLIFSYLQNKESINELFREISKKISNRNGGYCRIVKIGFRKNDAAEMAMIELVDYNSLYSQKNTLSDSTSQIKDANHNTRRSRKKSTTLVNNKTKEDNDKSSQQDAESSTTAIN